MSFGVSSAAVTRAANLGRGQNKATDDNAEPPPTCAERHHAPRRSPRLPLASDERMCSGQLYRYLCPSQGMQPMTPHRTPLLLQGLPMEPYHSESAGTPHEPRGMD